MNDNEVQTVDEGVELARQYPRETLVVMVQTRRLYAAAYAISLVVSSTTLLAAIGVSLSQTEPELERVVIAIALCMIAAALLGTRVMLLCKAKLLAMPTAAELQTALRVHDAGYGGKEQNDDDVDVAVLNAAMQGGVDAAPKRKKDRSHLRVVK